MKKLLFMIALLLSTQIYAQDKIVRQTELGDSTAVLRGLIGSGGGVTDTTSLSLRIDGKASIALDNLSTTSIGTDLIPSVTSSYSLGSAAKRWYIVYGDIFVRYDATGTYSNRLLFVEPTSSLKAIWIQDKAGTVALTADVATVDDSLASDISGKASTTLNNLGTTAINTDLLPGTDYTHNLGAAYNRWATLALSGAIFVLPEVGLNGLTLLINPANIPLAAPKVIYFPNKNGTIAVTSDIPDTTYLRADIAATTVIQDSLVLDIAENKLTTHFFTGTDSIHYGQDSIVVTHGVGSAPQYVSIQVISNSFGYPVWVNENSIGSTTFAVKRSGVGLETISSYIKFKWMAYK